MPQRRTENFTAPEKETVVKIVEQYTYIVEKKGTDGKTCQEKDLAWLDIANSFNEATTGVKRTPAQLQNLWRSLKQKTKKSIATQRQAITEGCAPPLPMDELSKKILSITQIEPIQVGESSPEIVTDETATSLSRKTEASNQLLSLYREAMSSQTAPVTSHLEEKELELKIRLCEMQLETERLKQQRERRRMEMDEELHEMKVKRMKEQF